MRWTTWTSAWVIAALACLADAPKLSAQNLSAPAAAAPPSPGAPAYAPPSPSGGGTVYAPPSPAAATPPAADGPVYDPGPPAQSCASGWYPCEMMGLPKTACEQNRVCQSEWKTCTPCYSMVGGAESTFLFPYFHGTSGQTLLTDGIIPINATSPGANDISGHLIVAPRVWIGLQGDKWGLVGRYWNAQSWRSGVGPGDPILGAGVIATNNFGVYLGDLEVQRRFAFGPMTLYGLFGVRYGSLRLSQGLTSSTFLGSDFLSAQTRTSQTFNGTGVTFGFWGTRDIGASPFSLFVSNRYSFLFGTAGAGAQTSATVLDPAGSTTGFNGATAQGNNGDLFIAEVQVGGQWQRKLNWFRGTAFIRSAFEYQYWNSSEKVFATATTVSFIGPNVAAATATSSNFFFNMVGVSLGAGIMY